MNFCSRVLMMKSIDFFFFFFYLLLTDEWDSIVEGGDLKVETI
jgi:hypothetical protein